MGETPKKYHITDKGDIYKINEDGSFTSMGNAEKMSSTNQTEKAISQSTEPSADDKPTKPFIDKKHRGVVLGFIISVFLVGGINLFYLLNRVFSLIFRKTSFKTLEKKYKHVLKNFDF